MKKEEWLKIAVKFDLGLCNFHKRPVEVECRKQINDSKLWVLKMHEWVLGKDGEFHYEPMPSSRTDEFIRLTRFNSPDECVTCYETKVFKEQKLYVG